jgi:hypothetical protein
VTDLVAGQFSGLTSYAGAVVAGAVTGGITAATGGASLLAAGAAASAGGASGNLTKQAIEIGAGDRQDLGLPELVQAGVVSGLAGGIGSRIPLPVPGITLGRNSYSAIAGATTTKLRNQTIANVSGQTIGKAIVANGVSGAPGEMLNNLGNSAYDLVESALLGARK